MKAVESEDELMAIKSEIGVMQGLTHPHIVGFHEAIETKNKMYIVMDLVTGGELFDCIIDREAFSESEVRDLMRALLSAVDHMHKRHVIHQVSNAKQILFSQLRLFPLTKYTTSVFHVFFLSNANANANSIAGHQAREHIARR